MGRACAAMLALAACYSPAPKAGAPCSTAGTCPTGLVCAADGRCQLSADGMSDAPANNVDAFACGADEAPCRAACAADACLKPAHVPTGFGTFAGSNLTPTTLTNATLATSTGAIGTVRGANANAATYEVIAGIGFVRRAQATGPAVSIWVFRDLTVTGRVTASGDGAVVLASTGTLQIGPNGIIDVSANGLVAGPGGLAGGTFRTAGSGCGGGGAPAGTGTSGDTGGTEGGGGGGGFGTPGGAGGTGGGTAGVGGVVCTTSLESILVGGSGGGGGDTSGTVPGPYGGGGGGALQLTAMGDLLVGGVIVAGGGGGRTAEGNGRDGAGGGAGGAVFLEAPSITIAGAIYANGGGGGSASAGTGSACAGPLAENGKASLAVASGSRCAIGFGGDGAAGSTSATVGQSGIAGGGGGGGLGRIVLRTLPGRTPTIVSSAVLSPRASSPAFQIVNTLD